MPSADLPETPEELARILNRFVQNGRVVILPTRRARRLLVLDHLAQRFEPGERYSEPQVNDLLRPAFDDVAALRRYLVDEGFLDREGGAYWRSGGTVDHA